MRGISRMAAERPDQGRDSRPPPVARPPQCPHSIRVLVALLILVLE